MKEINVDGSRFEMKLVANIDELGIHDQITGAIVYQPPHVYMNGVLMVYPNDALVMLVVANLLNKDDEIYREIIEQYVVKDNPNRIATSRFYSMIVVEHGKFW